MFDLFSHKESHKEAQASYEEFEAAQDRGEHHGHPKIAGAVTFLAMKRYDHEAKKKGKEPIGTMKELMASFAVAEIDKLVEEKVIPAAQAEWHKREAVKHVHAVADERYESEA